MRHPPQEKDVWPENSLQLVQNNGLGSGVELDRREADLLRLVIDTQKGRRLAAVDSDSHDHSIAYGLGDRNLVAPDHTKVAGWAPVFLKLVEVVELVLIRMLLPVGVVIPDPKRLIEVGRLDCRKKIVDAALGRPVPEPPRRSGYDDDRNQAGNDGVANDACAAGVICGRIEQSHEQMLLLFG